MPTERTKVPLKDGTRDFKNSPLFKRPAGFCVIITGDFERFQYVKIETSFLKN